MIDNPFETEDTSIVSPYSSSMPMTNWDEGEESSVENEVVENEEVNSDIGKDQGDIPGGRPGNGGEDGKVVQADEPDTPQASEEVKEEGKDAPEAIPDESVQEYIVPDFVPDDLIPPETFESPEKETEFYRDAYVKVLELHRSEEFVKSFVDAYEQQLIERSEEVEGLKAVNELFKGNPELAVKLYAPGYLVERGYDASFSENETNQLVSQALAKEFGKDYAAKYNPDEASDPDTLSGRMWTRQEAVIAEIKQRNTQIEKTAAQTAPPTPEEKQAFIDEQFKTQFEPQGFSRQDYDKFLNDAEVKSNSMTLADWHKVVEFEAYEKRAYQRGYNEGRKSLTDELTQSGKKMKPADEKPSERQAMKNSEPEYPPFVFHKNPFSNHK